MKDKKIIVTVLAVISLVVITIGVSYAFFNYMKEGTKENSITTGSITFLYTEISGVGKGIELSDAYPISDEEGKMQVGEGKVFEFKVTSTTPSKVNIPYEVTARKKSDSTLDEDAVKVYLTEVDGEEKEILLDNYSNLPTTSTEVPEGIVEKTLYKGKVPSNNTNYEKNFKLRMWIDDKIDFSPVKDEDGNDTYPYNDKTFTLTVNVYANANIITSTEETLESNADIKNVTINNTTVTKVEGKDYQYESILPEGTTSTEIEVETESPNASVKVEKIDSLVYSETKTNVKRLSTKKAVELTSGDNYFKVTVTSEDKTVTNEYKFKISVVELVSIFGKQYPVIQKVPTLTTSSNNTSDESGLYKSTNTNSGNSTYYFRGNVENNYVSFAGFTWRIVRINEDETVRIIMQDGINDNTVYRFNSKNSNYSYMYYSNSGIKTTLESWYQTNIGDKTNLVSKVVKGAYYCEQAKVKYSSSCTSGNATMTVYTSYTPNFKCATDGNGKGAVNASIGLLTYDEVVYAGGYPSKSNINYYLYDSNPFWTISPAGTSSGVSFVWRVENRGIYNGNVYDPTSVIRPVLNLNADVLVTGSGTSTDPYVVQS